LLEVRDQYLIGNIVPKAGGVSVVLEPAGAIVYAYIGSVYSPKPYIAAIGSVLR
jgi:hypothetical protein